ncbi:hypothetical protein R5R35_005113 [Gryllus longicercus]|uniref:Protein arginine methyltransferase NDUFAF7 n=1 Tax=Gryllus longicercus TaxID=2509291 RepID=A0AAN9V7B6_9ORTH
MNIFRATRRLIYLQANFRCGKKCMHMNGQNISDKLGRQLQARIKAMGPLTIADYMREVLTNPTSGYYQHKSAFGPAGDFMTSPEINQMFGELISVWFISEWQKIGAPAPFQIIELGPGNGSLMNDIIKVLVHFKIHKDVTIHLVEVSQRLASVQAEKLNVNLQHEKSSASTACYQRGRTNSGINVAWYSHIEDVPRSFSFIVANEFFDALPIHKFEKTDKGWREILVDVHPEQENVFRYVQSRFPTPATMFIKPNEVRNHVELSISTVLIVQHMASRVEEDGGIVLLADYGHDGSGCDTFRAFRQHKLHDPLVDPGTADLTADVDFSAIRNAAEPKLITYGPTDQGEFLERMGIKLRLNVLLEQCNDNEKTRLRSSYNMLVDSDKMGKRFKFFAMFPAVLKEHLDKFPVAGFF